MSAAQDDKASGALSLLNLHSRGVEMRIATVWALLLWPLICGADEPRPEDEWKRTILAKLERKISLDFMETPWVDVVAFLHAVSDVNLVLDQIDEESSVTIKVVDLKLDGALRLMTEVNGLAIRLTCGVIVVGKLSRLEQYDLAMPARPTAVEQQMAWEALQSHKLSLAMNDTSIKDVFDHLVEMAKSKCGVQIKIAEGLPLTEQVDLEVKDISLLHALSLVAGRSRARLVAQDDTWVIEQALKPSR